MSNDMKISEEQIRKIVKEEIEKTMHFTAERGGRVRAIEELGGYGKDICQRVVDRGHRNGPERFVLTSNAIIKVYNAVTGRYITDLIARPEQISDRLGDALNDLDDATYYRIMNLAREHERKDYNNR